jgi:hypothetical protein
MFRLSSFSRSNLDTMRFNTSSQATEVVPALHAPSVRNLAAKYAAYLRPDAV